LKNEAPRYAKLLPELPRLLHHALQHPPAQHRQELQRLIKEQRRTNRLLQAVLYGGVGFTLGLLAMQALTRARLWW
jgi:ubiquinone biosynthesis protein